MASWTGQVIRRIRRARSDGGSASTSGTISSTVVGLGIACSLPPVAEWSVWHHHWKVSHRFMTFAKLLSFLLILLPLRALQTAAFPSETPAKLTIPADAFQYTRQHVMIPMRDGVKLFTVVLVP